MSRKKLVLSAVLAVLTCYMGFLWVLPASASAKMIKEVAIGVFSNAPNQEACDRFYMRYHGPEITRLSGPWMTRYQLWLPYVPPKVAVERFGAVRGRYAELWYREQDYIDRPPLSGVVRPPFDTKNNPRPNLQTNILVPAQPTEVFYDSDPNPEQTSILRWVTIIRYPKGVSVKEGEKWFLDVYAKEAVKQPGLLKFVSYRALSIKSAGMPGGGKPPAGMKKLSGTKGMPPMPGRPWVRLCEYWYKNFAAWRKAVLESPPKYTTPPWGGKYPFVEMRSTFIPYNHDVDFLRGTYTVDFDMPKATYMIR